MEEEKEQRARDKGKIQCYMQHLQLIKPKKSFTKLTTICKIAK